VDYCSHTGGGRGGHEQVHFDWDVDLAVSTVVPRYLRGLPLAAGTRLGPYEIVAPLGARGMGEVYRRAERLHFLERPDVLSARQVRARARRN
jgi:hypothetical protein